MIPIVIGVAMAWYSEMEISRSAVWVSGVCVVLNATKVMINSEMLTGEYKVRLQYERPRLCFARRPTHPSATNHDRVFGRAPSNCQLVVYF